MKDFKPIATMAEKAAQAGLRKGGRAVLRRARELSPTDTGQSDKSGFTRIDDLTLQVGFTSHISRLQHEELDWQHKPGEQAKFLEQAEIDVDVMQYVADELFEAFK